ncbi:acyltransferase [Cereibacter sphaeroides]|uniref:acyltransferase n=1 Tax=Cereibacter sphaeroides TaxID=1063 RepID=UPI001F1913B9|nr:acyltransferase [Cereibacter sphaeroides]MCE6949722.1 acyltransferase [Cereibacter sphaeroides]
MDYQKKMYTNLELMEFKTHNPSNFHIDNVRVWFPLTLSGHLKSRVEFYIRAPVKNCNFIFFALPHKRSKLIISLKGSGHIAGFFSENQINLTIRMVGEDGRLAVGENCYINGATIIVNGTDILVGADGLWSDEILLQGSDSHGVIDLDTMEVVNAGRTHIYLKPHVWVGRRSTITKNVTINEGSIVAAAAVVTRDVPAACAVAGVPAKMIKDRVSWSRRDYGLDENEKYRLLRLRSKIDGSKTKL